jgi:hypothetical protein
MVCGTLLHDGLVWVSTASFCAVASCLCTNHSTQPPIVPCQSKWLHHGPSSARLSAGDRTGARARPTWPSCRKLLSFTPHAVLLPGRHACVCAGFAGPSSPACLFWEVPASVCFVYVRMCGRHNAYAEISTLCAQCPTVTALLNLNGRAGYLGRVAAACGDCLAAHAVARVTLLACLHRCIGCASCSLLAAGARNAQRHRRQLLSR